MLNSNSLRLGNLVCVNYKTDLISRVNLITCGSVSVEFNEQPDGVSGVTVSPNELIPIKINSRILRKISTRCIDGSFEIKSKDNSIRLVFRYLFGAYECAVFNEHGVIVVNNVEHLHNLQNLYFLFTGEEIDLKKILLS